MAKQKKRERGRPPERIIEPLPITFEEGMQLLVKPRTKEERIEILQDLPEERD